MTRSQSASANLAPSAPSVLSYAGPTVPARPAFNARRVWTWKGDHLFRIYVTPQHLWFVRIGGGKNSQRAATAQFGLLGALIGHFLQKQAKKKESRNVAINEDKPLPDLIAGHKLNHVLEAAEITDPGIEPRTIFTACAARLSFNAAKEKKRVICYLESVDDVSSAIQTLTPLFPSLRVGVQFNEKKKKYVKVN